MKAYTQNDVRIYTYHGTQKKNVFQGFNVYACGKAKQTNFKFYNSFSDQNKQTFQLHFEKLTFYLLLLSGLRVDKALIVYRIFRTENSMSQLIYITHNIQN